MAKVELDNEEWQRVLGILSQAPWNIANPLLMKIGEQLRQQSNSGSNSSIDEVNPSPSH